MAQFESSLAAAALTPDPARLDRLDEVSPGEGAGPDGVRLVMDPLLPTPRGLGATLRTGPSRYPTGQAARRS